MKTTVELPDTLVREIKMRAVMEGRKLKEVMADLLRAGLDATSHAASDTRRTKSTGLPVIQCRHAARNSGEVTPERAEEILRGQDVTWYAKTRR